MAAGARAGRLPDAWLNATAPLRILLADDHVTVRHGLKLLIDSQPDMKVIVGSQRRQGGHAERARAEARRRRHGHLDAGHERAGRHARA